MSLSRRSLLGGVIATLSAPAIVRASSLMGIPTPKIIVPEFWAFPSGYSAELYDLLIEKKLKALGISPEFLSGASTWSSTKLARELEMM